MAQGICENWKHSLAYFLFNEACSSEKVEEKLFQIIKKTENIGLSLLVAVCDIRSSFQKLYRELSLTYENPSSLMHNRNCLKPVWRKRWISQN